ncbi:MAG: stage 0 sporulation protein [Desulfobacter postgatei]|uniref:Stage 0 sporulation protein n=1 Tax=Desulfobacter postgatei TaxID=2293 RepID=A0A2G6MUJ7_9BACT|nr:MAG: stage 0 sporulation protein [Desulfobacter postgatei]
MVNVTGVRFKTAGKIYDFNSNALTVNIGDRVIVETEQGLGFGTIAIPSREKDKDEKSLKNIIRVATQEDFRRRTELELLEQRAHEYCVQCIKDLDLLMNLFSVESTFDRNKLTFFYTADGRIDFRELIKLLVKKFSIRIEMRQVGIRNLSKHVGGLGKCGRELCCSSFMHTFDPVSIKMAKEQGLSLNPTKISGVCGRLMCCLTFEDQTYRHYKKKMPKLGKIITVEDLKGKVVRQNVLRQSVTVRLDDRKEKEIFLSQLKKENA